MNYDKSLDRIVRIRAVLDRTGLSRSTVYRKIQEGTFPQSVKLGEHASGWRKVRPKPMDWRPDGLQRVTTQPHPRAQNFHGPPRVKRIQPTSGQLNGNSATRSREIIPEPPELL